MSPAGVLEAAWALTAFVIVAGIVLWVVTGRVVFVVFVALGVRTAVGAVVTARAGSHDARSTSGKSTSGKEEQP